jgi:hypothetical protein
MQHWHYLFGARDLLQRRLRTTPSQTGCSTAHRRILDRSRRVRLDAAGRDQCARQAKPHTGCTDRDAMTQGDRTDGFQIAGKHRVDDRRAKTILRQPIEMRPHHVGAAGDNSEIDQPDIGRALPRQYADEIGVVHRIERMIL